MTVAIRPLPGFYQFGVEGRLHSVQRGSRALAWEN